MFFQTLERSPVSQPDESPAKHALPHADRRIWVSSSAVFILLGIVLYLPALRSYFSSDDFLHLGTVVEGGVPFIPDGTGYGFLRPLVGWSFWAEYHLWGLQPPGYHATNILLHIANSLLVSLLALTVLPDSTRRRTISISAGLFFLTMACHAEAVAWISGRTDLIATFFSLTALCSVGVGARRGSSALLVGSLLPFAAALFSKESALALPFLLLALCLFIYVTGGWHAKARTARLVFVGGILIFLIYFWVRYATVGALIGGYGAHGHLRFHQDLLAQAMSRFAWRVYLPPLHSIGPQGFFASHGGALADAFTLAFGVITVSWLFMAWKRAAWRTGFYIFASFWVALLPVLNIRIQWTNVESERFLYLASIFAAIGAVYLIGRISRRSYRYTAMGVILVAQSLMLVNAVQRWEKAGDFARDIVTGIQALDEEGTIVFANKPDSFDGAIILRTGLDEAIRYFGDSPKPESQVEVLYASTLHQADHNFEMREFQDDRGVYLIEARDASSVMVEEDRLDRIETISGDQRGYRFRFREPLPDRKIVYYTSRGLHQLDLRKQSDQE
jgi:protein O-mannosyl-transferase